MEIIVKNTHLSFIALFIILNMNSHLHSMNVSKTTVYQELIIPNGSPFGLLDKLNEYISQPTSAHLNAITEYIHHNNIKLPHDIKNQSNALQITEYIHRKYFTIVDICGQLQKTIQTLEKKQREYLVESKEYASHTYIYQRTTTSLLHVLKSYIKKNNIKLMDQKELSDALTDNNKLSNSIIIINQALRNIEQSCCEDHVCTSNVRIALKYLTSSLSKYLIKQFKYQGKTLSGKATILKELHELLETAQALCPEEFNFAAAKGKMLDLHSTIANDFSDLLKNFTHDTSKPQKNLTILQEYDNLFIITAAIIDDLHSSQPDNDLLPLLERSCKEYVLKLEIAKMCNHLSLDVFPATYATDLMQSIINIAQLLQYANENDRLVLSENILCRNKFLHMFKLLTPNLQSLNDENIHAIQSQLQKFEDTVKQLYHEKSPEKEALSNIISFVQTKYAFLVSWKKLLTEINPKLKPSHRKSKRRTEKKQLNILSSMQTIIHKRMPINLEERQTLSALIQNASKEIENWPIKEIAEFTEICYGHKCESVLPWKIRNSSNFSADQTNPLLSGWLACSAFMQKNSDSDMMLPIVQEVSQNIADTVALRNACNECSATITRTKNIISNGKFITEECLKSINPGSDQALFCQRMELFKEYCNTNKKSLVDLGISPLITGFDKNSTYDENVLKLELTKTSNLFVSLEKAIDGKR